MPKIIGIIAALSVFSLWLSVVGNPHVVETVIGIILAAGAGIWAYIEAKKLANKYFSNSSSQNNKNVE